MTKLRMLPAAGVAVALLFVRADHVIGQPVEDCLLDTPVTAPELPRCGEPAEDLVHAPEVPAVSPPVDVPPALPPPVAPASGCLAVDPGRSRCSFTATGWIEAEVFAVIGYVDLLDSHGEQVGGFTGAGYNPPQLFGVVLPAAPGQRVVVRAESGWVVARNR